MSSWQDELIPMLRALINDLDCSSYTYSDDRLEQLLIVGARYVAQEIPFSTTYTVNVSDREISPDPTVTATRNDTFSNFIVLKAACLTDWSTFRTKALLAGITAKCGPASIATLSHLDGFKELVEKGPCAAYEKLKEEYAYGNTNVIHAVLSPFISNDFDPESLTQYYTPSDRNGDDLGNFYR